MTEQPLSIDDASPEDAPLVLAFIRELAAYEKLSQEVRATERDVRESLFGDAQQAFCRIARWGGEPAGFALYFHNYSTFLGRHGLYVEDVFVKDAFRGRGIGKALFADLAGIALDRGCGRIEWAVLDWNEPAIAFYRSLGAVARDEWTVFRLEGDDLTRLNALRRTAAGSRRGPDTPARPAPPERSRAPRPRRGE